MTKLVSSHAVRGASRKTDKDSAAPDVGVSEDLAKFYFTQLVAGLVSRHAMYQLSILITSTLHECYSHTSTPRVSVTGISSQKTCC